MNLKFSYNLFILTVLTLLMVSKPAQATLNYGSYSSMVKVKDKVQRHFDRDKDGYLNRLEFSRYKTHIVFNYPLVKKKKQKPYDFNDDRMLEPFEMHLYLKDKEAGNLKKPKKNNEGEDEENQTTVRGILTKTLDDLQLR